MSAGGKSYNKDYYGGALMILLGGSAAYAAQSYNIGSLAHMGPGYFPFAVGILLALTGVLMVALTPVRMVVRTPVLMAARTPVPMVALGTTRSPRCGSPAWRRSSTAGSASDRPRRWLTALSRSATQSRPTSTPRPIRTCTAPGTFRPSRTCGSSTQGSPSAPGSTAPNNPRGH